jgi:hypothetical protein
MKYKKMDRSVIVRITALWNMTLYSLVNADQCFGVTFIIRVNVSSTLKMEEATFVCNVTTSTSYVFFIDGLFNNAFSD